MKSEFLNLSDIQEKEIAPGFWARMIHMEGCSVGHIRVVKGAELPEHSHLHEQVTNIISGTFEMTVGGVNHHCKAGDVVVIPAHVPHSGKAHTDCKIIDVFQPVREDYK